MRRTCGKTAAQAVDTPMNESRGSVENRLNVVSKEE
jgi:hypothetical protein